MIDVWLILPVMARLPKKLPFPVLAVKAFDLDARTDEVVTDLATERPIPSAARRSGRGSWC